jgi:FdhD protein
MMVIPAPVRKLFLQAEDSFTDALASEEPLEIRLLTVIDGDVKEQSVAITMRTPGNDAELAIGFLFSEGIITSLNQVKEVKHCQKATAQSGNENVLRVQLQPGIVPNPALLKRNFYTASSCGVCGKASIEAVAQASTLREPKPILVNREVLFGLPDLLLKAQSAFKVTGGMHAAALFTADGNLINFREDVGRHNALDKLLGKALLDGISLHTCLLLLSGRISFELVQKASVSQLPVIIGIGAPSSLAVNLAQECGITLLGFLRAASCNVYTHMERVL